jgi:hypothetical protein
MPWVISHLLSGKIFFSHYGLVNEDLKFVLGTHNPPYGNSVLFYSENI